MRVKVCWRLVMQWQEQQCDMGWGEFIEGEEGGEEGFVLSKRLEILEEEGQ